MAPVDVIHQDGPSAGLPPYPAPHDTETENMELRGLLSGVQASTKSKKSRLYQYPYDTFTEWLDTSTPSRRNRVAAMAVVIVVLLLGGLIARPLLSARPRGTHPNACFSGEILRSNGTHEYKRTVVLVSIDGLRADYLDRGFTPHLLSISEKGMRAKYMQPVFPTLTFPNHWALMTGLYAESHGIVANARNFWDPRTETEFYYNKESSAWIPDWWLGEPMWETTGKAGIISANLMWPGPPKTTSGATPDYFVPWRDKVPLSEKLDQIINWINLPLEERPQLILAYEPSLDQAGHLTGPYSKLVNDTLKYVDEFARDLHESLAAWNLTEIVDVVFVSDHGMTDTSHPELVYIDDILGVEGYQSIEHEDGWPSMGMRFAPHVNATHYLDILLEAQRANSEKFDVYTHETMPEKYHFANNERIAPIYVVPKIGYALTTRKEGDVGMSKGNHGYANDESSMFAMFVAHGPFATNVKDVQYSRRSLFSRLSSPSKRSPGWHSTEGAIYVMDGFENVQIYGLVMKLLGIQKWAARTNGTKGFWDQYF